MIFLFVVGLVFLNTYIYKATQDSCLKKQFLPALLCKFACSIALGIIYYYYYNGIGDTFSLFEDAKRLSSLARLDFSRYAHFFLTSDFSHLNGIIELLHKNPRAVFAAKLMSLVCLCTEQNYWLTGIALSNLSFWSIWLWSSFLIKKFSESRLPIIIAFFYLPSFVFWSSGVLKEPIAVSAFLYIAYYFLSIQRIALFQIWRLKPLAKAFLCAVSLYVLFKLKYYYFALLIPFLLAFRISQYTNYKWRWLLFFGLLIIFGVIASFIHPNLHPESILQNIITNNQLMELHTFRKENLIIFNNLTPHWTSFLLHFPKAIFEGLLRPFIWEEGNILKKIVALENIGILLILILSSFQFRISKNTEKKDLGILVLVFCLCLIPILTWASPNLGTLVRYKIMVVPFLVCILLSNLCTSQKDI